MDPLSIIASVAGIGGAVVSSAKVLYDLVQTIRDAPQELTAIADSVHGFYSIVYNLQTALNEDAIRDVVQEDPAMLNMVSDLRNPLKRCSELLGQLMLKVRSRLKPTEDGKGMKFGTSDFMWYFARRDVHALMTRLEASRSNVDTSLNSITVLCVVRLRAAGVKPKAPTNVTRKDLVDNDAGSALRYYVKESSIAGSIAPSIENLTVRDSQQDTVVPNSRSRTPSPQRFIISEATERMRKADNQRTALHNAAKSGEDLNIIELIIEDGADVNAKDADGMTALHFAAMDGKENAVLVLLQNGANVHAQTVPPKRSSETWQWKFLGGRTPLHWAANEGYTAIVDTLLDHGADPGAKNTTYRTPLQEAIMHGHESVALTLIARGAPITDSDDEDWTPLHECSYGGSDGSKAHAARVRIARFLLDRGADVDAVTADKNWLGMSMLRGAATPLLLSSMTNKIESAALLIERGANLRAFNKGGEMPIHIAAFSDHLEFINVLLDAGIETDLRDPRLNETALHKAASQNRLPATRLLLERGADPSAVSKAGRNVLQHTIAVQREKADPEIIRLLTERLEKDV